jgi:transposase
MLEQHPRLETVYFPPASPELNPQEHVWSAEVLGRLERWKAGL